MGTIRIAGVAKLFLVAGLAGGCADQADPERGPYAPFPWCTIADFQRPEVERVTIDVAATPAAGRPEFGTVLDGALSDNPTACDCTDATCMIEWIEDNLGCGVCVHLSCGGQPRAGCVPCPGPTDSSASRDDTDDSTCVLAPVATNPPSWDVQVQPSSSWLPAPSRAPALDRDITRQPR